jgi:Holliday junction resolvase
LEYKLAEQLEQLARLRSRQSWESIEPILDRQTLMVTQLDEVSRSEVASRRLLTGYVVLTGTGVVAGVAVTAATNASIRASTIAWTGVGLAIAGTLAALLFYFAQRTSGALRIAFPLEGVLEVESAIVEPVAPLAVRRATQEDHVLRWLRGQGWAAKHEPADRGFDLICRREDETLLVELKTTSRLRLKDVDALVGAAFRYRRTVPGTEPRIALVAPAEAVDHAHRVVQVAAGEGIEVYEITPGGDVRHVDDPQHDRMPDTPDRTQGDA